MKRKFFLILLSLFLSMHFCIAANLQNIYLNSDDIWIRTNRLCISAGNLGPTPVSPTTGAEIKNALERLDYDSLSASQKKEYDYLMSEISSPESGVSFSAKNVTVDPELFIGVEGFAFNNLKNTPIDEFFIPYRDQIPFFSAGIDAYFGDIAYVGMDYMYKDAMTGFTLDSDGNVIKGDNFYSFTNFSFLIAPTFDDEWAFLMNSNDDHTFSLLTYQPTKTGASIGNDFMNFFIGRTRQSFGNGITGNFVIGDNFSFQETARLSFFSDIFSYYLSLTHFDNIEEGKAFKLDGLHQNRLIHRFDINLFNKFRFTLNIGAHILSDSPFDLRMFNPMMIIHNWNNNKEHIAWDVDNRDEVNNLMGFEFEYSFYPGFLATAQIVIDQFRLPVEKNSTVPSAFGILANIKNVSEIGDGSLESYIEIAYTSPYLYLNYKTYKGDDMYMLDHIVGYVLDSYLEVGYTGYTYGPDAIVLSLGGNYLSYDSWSINGNLMYMAHGEYGKESWRNKNNRDNESPSTPSGIVEHTFSITLKGEYNILDNLELSAGILTSFKWNYHNIENEFRTDVQAAVGLSWVII